MQRGTICSGLSLDLGHLLFFQADNSFYEPGMLGAGQAAFNRQKSPYAYAPLTSK
jgi:hypothetical protein